MIKSDSIDETEWIRSQRATIESYLKREGLANVAITGAPDGFVAPYVAVWAIPSLKSPGTIGWWGISGDLPTDYISSTAARDAREALAAFSKQ